MPCAFWENWKVLLSSEILSICKLSNWLTSVTVFHNFSWVQWVAYDWSSFPTPSFHSELCSLVHLCFQGRWMYHCPLLKIVSAFHLLPFGRSNFTAARIEWNRKSLMKVISASFSRAVFHDIWVFLSHCAIFHCKDGLAEWKAFLLRLWFPQIVYHWEEIYLWGISVSSGPVNCEDLWRKLPLTVKLMWFVFACPLNSHKRVMKSSFECQGILLKVQKCFEFCLCLYCEWQIEIKKRYAFLKKAGAHGFFLQCFIITCLPHLLLKTGSFWRCSGLSWQVIPLCNWEFITAMR